jgi:hypothetical protein
MGRRLDTSAVTVVRDEVVDGERVIESHVNAASGGKVFIVDRNVAWGDTWFCTCFRPDCAHVRETRRATAA